MGKKEEVWDIVGILGYKEKCITLINKTPDDQLGRIGKEDKLNGWQKLCNRPSLLIFKEGG